MKFQGAVIKEQGLTFAIVIAKKSVLDNVSGAKKMIASFQPVFPGMPIVLMAQDYKVTPIYYGRTDIVKFLANTPLHAIPWKEYAVS